LSYIGQRPVVGRYIKLDQISSGFNGSNTGFSMTAGSQAVFPGTARNLLLSLGGVIQEPDTDFTISGSTLTFTTPPVANTTFFGVIYGDMQATGTPSDGTVLPASIASSGNFSFPEVTVTGDVNIADSIIHSGDSDTKIRFPSNDAFRVQIGGAQRLDFDGSTTVFNDDAGNVDFRIEGDNDASLFFADASTDRIGIGTTSPSSKLHIDGGNVTNSFEIDGTGGHELYSYHDSDGVGWATGPGGSYGELLYLDESGSTVRLYSGGTERFRVSGSEVVVNEPGASVDFRVEGDTDANLLFVDASTDRVGIGTSSPINSLHVVDAGTGGDGTLSIGGSGTNATGQLFYEISGATYLRIKNSYRATNSNAYIEYDAGHHRFTTGTSGNEAMRIQSGNVGIGTTSPARLLHLNGSDSDTVQLHITNSTTGSTGSDGVSFALGSDESLIINQRESNHIALKTADTERMRITSDGNVLIGTTTAGEGTADDLTIANSSHAGITIRSGTSSESNIFFADGTSGNAQFRGMVRYFHSSDALAFNTSATERMRIDSHGRFLLRNTVVRSVGGHNALFHQEGADFHDATHTIVANSGDTNGAYLILGKQRSGGIGGGSAVQNGDEVGVIRFAAHDGNDFAHRVAEIKAMVDGTAGTDDLPGRLSFFTVPDGSITSTERLRIHSTGVVQVMSEKLTLGTSATTGGASEGNLTIAFSSATQNGIKLRDTHNAGSTNYVVLIAGSTIVGSITGTTGQASFNNLSDYRTKENDVKITDGIEKIKLLRPIRFNFKHDSKTLCDGFFAHEVTPAVPTAVTGEKDAVDSEGKIDPQMLDSSKLIPLLVAALKEEISKRESLEARVAALEAA